MLANQCRVGSSSSGGMHISPRNFNLGNAATAVARAGNSAGVTPPLEASPAMFTCRHTFNGAAWKGRWFRKPFPRSSGDLLRGTQSKEAATGRVLFACRRPMKCQVRDRFAQGLDLLQTLLNVLSPKSRTPSCATARTLLPLRLAHRQECDRIGHSGSAAAAAELMRLRTIRTRSGKFCGPINILDTEPLRYNPLAEIACGNFRGIELSGPIGAGQKARLLPGRWVERAAGNCEQALGASMAVDIAQLLAFAVKTMRPICLVRRRSADDPRRWRHEAHQHAALAHKRSAQHGLRHLNDKQRKAYEEFFETDFSFEIPKLARFRVNAFNRTAAPVPCSATFLRHPVPGRSAVAEDLPRLWMLPGDWCCDGPHRLGQVHDARPAWSITVTTIAPTTSSRSKTDRVSCTSPSAAW